jgi:hypothetical protein
MTQANVPGMTTQDVTSAVASTGEAPAHRRSAEPAHDASILESVMTETEKWRNALESTTGQEAWLEAGRVFRAGMCGVQSIEDAYIRIRTGRSLGMPAMASIQGIDLIDGRPSLKARTKIALCLSRNDVIKYFRLISTSDEESTWEAQRIGDPPQRFQYTIAMAEKAGLTSRGKTEEAKKNSNWVKHTAAMLRARASGTLADLVAADITLGLETSEVMIDVRDERMERDGGGAAATDQPTAPPPQAAPSRDWDSERAILLHRINDAVSLESLKPIRMEIGKFIEEAPTEHGDAVKAQYNKTMSALKQSAT